MGRTYKDSDHKSKRPSKKAKRDLEKLQAPQDTWNGKLDPRNGNQFKSSYKKLKVEEK